MAAFENLSLLRAFVGIVESGSISAGARRLKLPQPTLSRYLRQLEQQAGAVLLRRDTHRMSLTETGHWLLADARAMLALAEDAEQRLHEDQGVARAFAFVCDDRLWTNDGHEADGQLPADESGRDGGTRLHESPPPCYSRGVRCRRRGRRYHRRYVVARPCGKIVRYLVASSTFLKSHSQPRKVSDLASWPWITLSPRFGVGKDVTLYSAKRGEQTFRISPVLISEGVTSLREAVRTGLGIAIISEWVIREDLRLGRLVRVFPQWNAKEFPAHVVYPGRRALPTRVRAFIDFAVKYMTTELHPRV